MIKGKLQILREYALALSDYLDNQCGVGGAITPPKRLYYKYGGGSYSEIGLEFLSYFLDLCDLRRDARVLDVGCGIGRMALPLTAYLSKAGSYEGFDIIASGIEYCSDKFTSRFPNFKFRAADVHNAFYNPRGTQAPESYRFPFDDDCFDFVFSTSVLTHLKPPAMARYVAESRRVLKPGGVCFHTCFLVDDASERLMLEGAAPHRIVHRQDGFFTDNPAYIESAVAVPEADVMAMFEQAGLKNLKIAYGAWSGRSGDTTSFQDICVASRPA